MAASSSGPSDVEESFVLVSEESGDEDDAMGRSENGEGDSEMVEKDKPRGLYDDKEVGGNEE